MEPGLEWRAIEWRDGATYEGLVKDRRLHSHGVLRFPNKDRFEGQFTNGVFDGYGVYVWADGTVYRGEWMQGEMHGCGIKLWRDDEASPQQQQKQQQQPSAPRQAAAAAAAASTSSAQLALRPTSSVVVRAAEGRFARDFFAGPGLSPCDDPQSALDAAAEADYAAAQARSFSGALAAVRGARQEGRVGAGGGGGRQQQQQQHQQPQAKRREGVASSGWFGGLFAGLGGNKGAPVDGGAAIGADARGPLSLAPSSSSVPRPAAMAGGGASSLASMKPGDRELLGALVDRMMEHEISLAMQQQQQQQKQPHQRPQQRQE